MTEQELAAAITLICGETVKFEYSVRTKRGKATSTWVMYQKSKWSMDYWFKHPERTVTGPNKTMTWAEMETKAVEWADQQVQVRNRMREYWSKRANQK